MIRTQIQLPSSVHKALKRWAAQREISLAEAVRRCVARTLAEDDKAPGRESLVREAMSVVGKYKDPAGPARVARDHDDHLYEAYKK